MAKSNGTIKTVSMIVGFLVIFASVIFTATNVHGLAKENGKDLTDHEARIRLIEKELPQMAADVKAIRVIMEHQLKETPK